jgi:diaminohydroxyphosphoribosylaminopyrimidine deaminase/5-amino-6-(5-phosphoribosylamino)uracil reductase
MISPMNDLPSYYMMSALHLAQQGQMTVSPNPMVGCIVVKDERIVGQGYHQYAGGPHAEINALAMAGTAAQQATLYVTLEPCCHHGRTPPCTEALIRAGIKKIYIACLDPNPLVAGKSVAILRAHGIEVEVGLCEAQVMKLNEIFFHFMTHRRPFVIAKWAMSLDGKMRVHAHDSPQISSEAAQVQTHQLRQQVDAILIGANTARHDDPLLTVRADVLSTLPSKQPLRIILTSEGQLPSHLKLFQADLLPGKTLIATTHAADSAWCEAMTSQHVEVMQLEKNEVGRVSLVHLLYELGKRQITSLLVEGGRTILEDFFAQNLVNKIHAYVAPVIIGSLTKKQELKNMSVSVLGSDFHFVADF